jgi:hypothetical protein
MQQFIVFYKADLAGKAAPALGSDGVLIVDGRFGKERTYAAAREQAQKLRKVSPFLLGFRLYKGERFTNARPVGGIHAIRPDTAKALEQACRKGIVEW